MITNKMSVDKIIEILEKNYPSLPMQESFGNEPYKLLVAVMLSARSRDEITIPTAKKLFKIADNPEEMMKVSGQKLEKILRPIGFYRQKAKYLKKLSERIVERFDGEVPETRKDLVSLAGVGRKTANIVLAQYFKKSVIGVDTHVHRISNRIGWVETEKPEETEKELCRVVPKKYWKKINQLLVRHGQEICQPRKPKCKSCPIERYCEKSWK